MVDCLPEGAAVPGDLVTPHIISGTIWTWADLGQLRQFWSQRGGLPSVRAARVAVDCTTQPVGLVLAAAFAHDAYFVYVLFPEGAGWINARLGRPLGPERVVL